MRWLLRPSTLIFVSLVLTMSAATLALWPRAPANRAVPLPVQDGDQEIVWLYAATNSAPWERFVSALSLARTRQASDAPGHTFRLDDHNAFPDQTTAVPEVALSMPGARARLRIHWYKLTSDLKTQDWVTALLQRQPPPLAIIGGSSSDLAIDLARHLEAEASRQRLGSACPLLLLTTATAHAAEAEPGQTEAPLHTLYPGRTYRFCFTNQQMAEAVTSFIWNRPDLRPDTDPFYVTFWQDDPYSTDLNRRFCDVLWGPAYLTAAQDWAWQAGTAALGNMPLDLMSFRSQFRMATPSHSARILYSVGAFEQPNRWETGEARLLMETKLEHPLQRRPLLIIPAQTQPVRRFLRAMVRSAPVEARRFVVATGDAIAFNTIYRDRDIAWQIQDLPFSLVCFCHRNPIDPRAGFPLDKAMQSAESSDPATVAAGTEDLLLFADIASALAQACSGPNGESGKSDLPADAPQLARLLQSARWSEEHDGIVFGSAGQPLFDQNGNRRSATGEHVVLLLPTLRGREVLPEARIEVSSWQLDQETGKHAWRPRAKPLVVRYEGYVEQDSSDTPAVAVKP